MLLLEAVARQLDDDLLRDFVFIGGAVAGLLITDSAAPAIRATEDVDLIVQVATLADYHRVEARGLLARYKSGGADLSLADWRSGGGRNANVGEHPRLFESLVPAGHYHRAAAGATEWSNDSAHHGAGFSGD